MRIEDVDRTREVPGAADDILRTLERFGLTWDGPVWRQSTRVPAYEAALARLATAGLTYPCACSRAELALAAGSDAEAERAERPYPGRCRRGPVRASERYALRFRVEGAPPVTVEDRLQPPLTQSVDAAVGDFVLRRRDGFYAYQLAVVVDDADQGVTDVVRGLDLYDNTPRQLLLQRALGLPTPAYLHLPLVVGPTGAKLAKSHAAPPVEAGAVSSALATVLGWLGHPPPPVLRGAAPQALLAWAVDEWDINKIQRVKIVSSEP